MIPTVLCLCPTYNRPAHLVSNALACFEIQDYPASHRVLFILDDKPCYSMQRGTNWIVWAENRRYPSLPAKYNEMLRMIRDIPWCQFTGYPPSNDLPTPSPLTIHHQHHHPWNCHPDLVLVWDDDDVYLPWHISSYVEALQQPRIHHQPSELRPGWVHPTIVWTDYPGRLIQEIATGRFHGSLGVSWELLDLLEGWVTTKRADFDQQMIAKLHKSLPPSRPPVRYPPSYIFRWGSTGGAHCQSHMKTPANETWYEDYAMLATPQPYRGELVAAMDKTTSQYIKEIAAGFVPQPAS